MKFLPTLLALLALGAASPAFAEATRLSLAFPSVGTLVSGQIGVALQKTDIMKKHGLDARITPMPLGRELKEAMAAGQVDAIFTSESNFIVLLGQGYPCRAIGTFGTMGEMALVVKPGSPIQTVAALRGRKVATIFGTSLHQPAVEWPREAGLDPQKDIQLVNMRGMGPMNAAFASGDVDAMVTFDPYLLQGLKAKEVRVLRKTGLDGIILVSESFIQAHPKAAREFKAALADATLYMAQHKQEVARWASELNGFPAELLDEGSRVNANYQARSLSQIDLSISPQYREKLVRLAEFFRKEKLIDAPAEVAKHLD